MRPNQTRKKIHQILVFYSFFLRPVLSGSLSYVFLNLVVAITTKEIMRTHCHVPVVISGRSSVDSVLCVCDVRYSQESNLAVFSGLDEDVFVILGAGV